MYSMRVVPETADFGIWSYCAFCVYVCPVSHTLHPPQILVTVIVTEHAAGMSLQMTTEFFVLFCLRLSLKPSKLAQLLTKSVEKLKFRLCFQGTQTKTEA